MKRLLLFIALFPLLSNAQVKIYTNGFEGPGQTFYTDPGSDWERGVPTMSRIDTAHGGTKVWATDLDSNYKTTATYNSNTHLYTPYYIVSGVDSVVLSFWQYVDLDSAYFSANSAMDGVNVYVRFDAMQAWGLLGFMGFYPSTNWYNSVYAGKHIWYYKDSGWFYSKIVLKTLLFNRDSIQFRFTLNRHVNQQVFHHDRNGWAIDDFRLEVYGSGQDLSVKRFVYPADTTTTLTNIPVEVMVENNGQKAVNLLQPNLFTYSVNGHSTPVIGVPRSNKINLMPGDSEVVVFSTLTTQSMGTLSFCVSTNLSKDMDKTNDMKCRTAALVANATEILTNINSLPNPVSDELSIVFHSRISGILNMQMYNAVGNMVLSRDFQIEAGENHLELNMSDYPSGIYYYRIYLDGAVYTRKIVIAR